MPHLLRPLLHRNSLVIQRLKRRIRRQDTRPKALLRRPRRRSPAPRPVVLLHLRLARNLAAPEQRPQRRQTRRDVPDPDLHAREQADVGGRVGEVVVSGGDDEAEAGDVEDADDETEAEEADEAHLLAALDLQGYQGGHGEDDDGEVEDDVDGAGADFLLFDVAAVAVGVGRVPLLGDGLADGEEEGHVRNVVEDDERVEGVGGHAEGGGAAGTDGAVEEDAKVEVEEGELEEGGGGDPEEAGGVEDLG